MKVKFLERKEKCVRFDSLAPGAVFVRQTKGKREKELLIKINLKYRRDITDSAMFCKGGTTVYVNNDMEVIPIYGEFVEVEC